MVFWVAHTVAAWSRRTSGQRSASSRTQPATSVCFAPSANGVAARLSLLPWLLGLDARVDDPVIISGQSWKTPGTVALLDDVKRIVAREKLQGGEDNLASVNVLNCQRQPTAPNAESAVQGTLCTTRVQSNSRLQIAASRILANSKEVMFWNTRTARS